MRDEQGRRWWSRPDSNRRPPACKAGALPAELRPQSGQIWKRTTSLPEREPAPLKFTLCDQPEPIPLLDRTCVQFHLGLRPSVFSDPCGALKNRLLRKEVIQPQVPLRLPCYDFVPITSLTLGRRLPCGLTNALRAKPAFMT